MASVIFSNRFPAFSLKGPLENFDKLSFWLLQISRKKIAKPLFSGYFKKKLVFLQENRGSSHAPLLWPNRPLDRFLYAVLRVHSFFFQNAGQDQRLFKGVEQGQDRRREQQEEAILHWQTAVPLKSCWNICFNGKPDFRIDWQLRGGFDFEV